MKLTIRLLPVLAALGLMSAAPAHAFLQLNDQKLPEISTDLRPGKLEPSAQQLNLVKQLKASANFNRFGTVNSMIRYGGFLGSGFGGTPAEGAREWVRQNRALFKLSEAGVNDLELVNEGVMPHTDARAVLFRQRFGGMRVSHDGLITVGIVKGKVYYVSSSSAGDQPMPGPARLSALQAWLKAAANVNRVVGLSDVLAQEDRTERSGWHLFKVLGFSQPQRARLVALPMPAGGVRQAWETIVVDQQSSLLLGYTHFIDAQTGEVLIRVNRVQNQSAGALGETFQGAWADGASCGPRHDFTVGEGVTSARVIVHMLNPVNDANISLYYQGPTGEQKVGAYDLLGGTEVFNYSTDTGVPAGQYQVEICPVAGSTVPVTLPPYNYAGTFTASSGSDAGGGTAPGGLVYGTAKWRWFPASPKLDLSTEDTRLTACFGSSQVGCDENVTNVAARQPWDMIGGLVPTFTSVGNAAITSGSAFNPVLGPSNMRVATPSPTRNYDYAFNNAWKEGGCSPVDAVGAVVPVGNLNDIDASVTNLFVAHNRMHDWSYTLGFTELNYNMQVSNFGITGAAVANDPEIGGSQAGGVDGGWPLFLGRDNAGQASFPDGVPGITNQYLFQPIAGAFYAPCTDGSYDMGIVGHEYTHAITNRMIGGPDQNIGGEQGGSMGESWGDLSALEHELEYSYRDQFNELTGLATYVSGGDGTAFRNYQLALNPLNYSNFGYDTPGPEVHADGEIWNGTQWALRQAFIDYWQAQFPYEDKALQERCARDIVSPEGCPGNRRWIQVMYDSFLLMPASPSMLDARDAMLAADMARFGGANQEIMWRAFAARGMGVNAFSNGGDDLVPVANFESPLADDEATITVKVLAGDEKDAAIETAKVYIGEYATRSRPVADTDPATVIDPIDDFTMRATSNLSDTFSIVPGTYSVIVEAPGYGQHRFVRSFAKGAATLTFRLPTNLASLSKGAAVVTSATLPENQEKKDTLIDDSENTGAVVGDVAPIAGASITVALAGGEHEISRVHVSTAAGPDNPGRFNALRAFEIRTCSGECSDPVADFDNVVYTSAPDAFPARKARPLQPQMILRSFDFPAVKATHVQLRVLTSQCTGSPEYAGEQDSDPLNSTDCTTSTPPPDPTDPTSLGSGVAFGSVVRATEFQVFAHAAEDPAEGAKGGIISGIKGRFGGAFGFGLLLPLLGFAALRRRFG